VSNLANVLIDTGRTHPGRPAIRLDDVVLSYAELDDLTARVGGWLRGRGIRPGDRVGLMLPNVAQFPVLYFGALRAGGVVVPMNPLLKAREVEHCLGDSGAKLALVWTASAAEGHAGARAVGTDVVLVDDGTLADVDGWTPAPEVADQADDDTALILYTSGTTGIPKGAELTHANMLSTAGPPPP
jgi:long-chain acyl-CoA synthetase